MKTSDSEKAQGAGSRGGDPARGQIITFILIVSVIVGCRPSCIETIEKYPDGRIHTRVLSCEDSSYNLYQSFYHDGQLKQVKRLIDGMTYGLVTSYDSLGHLSWKAYYQRDTLNGPYEDYFSNGQVSTRSSFMNGLQNGKYITFYHDGSTKTTAHFKNGKQVGEFIEYHPNGNIMMHAYLQYGITVEYIEYDSTGHQINHWQALDWPAILHENREATSTGFPKWDSRRSPHSRKSPMQLPR